VYGNFKSYANQTTQHDISDTKGHCIIYGGGWHWREKGWLNKIFLCKRLGKWRKKQLKGWVIKIYCHFQSMTPLNIWRLKSNVNGHMSILYVNQSESLSWSFSDLSGDKRCLQRKYMCRQHETLDCRKLHKHVVIKHMS
jgi:hypothetical protein